MATDATTAARSQMGYIEATSYVVGNVIGSGIFITPTSILSYTNSVGLSLLVWLGCGLVSVLGSLCYIELATAIPDPGCDFAYSVFVGWHAVAFAFMWVSSLLTYPASAAVQAQTFGQYIMEGLAPVWTPTYGWERTDIERLLGLILLALLTWLNFYSLERAAARFQVVATTAKLLALATIIVSGFYLLIFRGWTEHFHDPFKGSVWSAGKLALAFYGGLWSYSGWDILNYGTPEIRNPRRTIPLALISGLGLVMAIYVSINTAYFVVLSPDDLKNSSAVAADFGQKVLGPVQYAVPFMVALLLVGTLNSNIFCGSRFMHAASRRGHLPAALSALNPGSGSPRVAVAAQGVLTVAISMVSIDALINYVTFVMWGQKAVTASVLLILRLRRIPVHKDVIRMPFPMLVLFFVVSLALVLVPFIEEFYVTLIGLAIVFSGLIFYFVLVKPARLPTPLERFHEMTTALCERVFNCKRDLQTETRPGRGSSMNNADAKAGNDEDAEAVLPMAEREDETTS